MSRRCFICQMFFISGSNSIFCDTERCLFSGTSSAYYKKDTTKFCREINELSKGFVSQYNESEWAEKLGIIDICRLWYRRALEYLVKDFAIKLLPEKEEEILADNSLSNVINNRLPEKYGIREIKKIVNCAW